MRFENSPKMINNQNEGFSFVEQNMFCVSEQRTTGYPGDF